jgi:hypothetical protein
LKAPVNAYKAIMTTIPVGIPAAGVLTPALDLSADLENDPVEGYALKSVPNVLLTPIAINSWFGLILYPFNRPNDLAMEMCSSKRTMTETGSLGARAESKELEMYG